MDSSSIGPLLPNTSEGTTQQTAVASAFAALVAIGSRSPRAVERVTELALGVGISVKPIGVTVSPTILTWGLPQPVGILPPEPLGLDADWWIPGAFRHPPEWVPGSERRNQRTANHAAAEEERIAALQLQDALGFVNTKSDAEIQGLIADVLDPTSLTHSYTVRPDDIADSFRSVLAARAAARAIATGAADATQQLSVTTIPIPPQQTGFPAAVATTARAARPTPDGAFPDALMAKLGTDP